VEDTRFDVSDNISSYYILAPECNFQELTIGSWINFVQN